MELIPQESAIEKLNLREHELELCSRVKLAPGAASIETIIQVLKLMTKQYLPPGLSEWTQTCSASEIQLTSGGKCISILGQSVGEGGVGEKTLLVTWPFAVDADANTFVARLQKDFTKVAPK